IRPPHRWRLPISPKFRVQVWKIARSLRRSVHPTFSMLARTWTTRVIPLCILLAAASSEKAVVLLGKARAFLATVSKDGSSVPGMRPGTRELLRGLARCRSAFIGLALASGVLNLVMLV